MTEGSKKPKQEWWKLHGSVKTTRNTERARVIAMQGGCRHAKAATLFISGDER